MPPRLLSVVPMIGIQFAVYEFIKRLLLKPKLNEEICKSNTQREKPHIENNRK